MEEMAAGVGEGAVCVSGVSVTQEATVCLKGGCECPRMSRTGCKIHVCVSMGVGWETDGDWESLRLA